MQWSLHYQTRWPATIWGKYTTHQYSIHTSKNWCTVIIITMLAILEILNILGLGCHLTKTLLECTLLTTTSTKILKSIPPKPSGWNTAVPWFIERYQTIRCAKLISCWIVFFFLVFQEGNHILNRKKLAIAMIISVLITVLTDDHYHNHCIELSMHIGRCWPILSTRN